MKDEIRTVVIFLSGVGTAALWLFLSIPWSTHIEFGFIYPALYRIAGVNGPWMASVGSVLFALITALAASLCVVFVFGNVRWLMLGIFVLGYLAGQLLNSWWSATSLPYLFAYSPLWLFVMFFVVASSVLSSHLSGIWPNNTLKGDAAKPRTLG